MGNPARRPRHGWFRRLPQFSAGAVLLGVWASGAAIMAARLLVRLPWEWTSRRTADGRNATAFRRRLFADGVPVVLSAAGQGPSVEGVLRPRITLPPDIDGLLTERGADAVLIHEVTHARRRDNLVALIHEIALCGLWFHPVARRLTPCSVQGAVLRRGRNR